MRINFFEEYPTLENLEKAKLIDFPSTIFLAAHSLEEFYKYREDLLNINNKLEVAYWPIVPRTYWISPFSYTKDLEDLFKDLKQNKEPLTLLIDLELPLVKHRFLFLKNISYFSRNKKIIGNFLKEASFHNLNIVTAEYCPFNSLFLSIYRKLGISFDPAIFKNNICYMYYTSMFPNKYIYRKMTNLLSSLKKNGNRNIELGLGAIATGVLGNEPNLPPEDLSRDLSFMKENNFETATIFRLGGFNKEYYKVVKPFI